MLCVAFSMLCVLFTMMAMILTMLFAVMTVLFAVMLEENFRILPLMALAGTKSGYSDEGDDGAKVGESHWVQRVRFTGGGEIHGGATKINGRFFLGFCGGNG